MVHPALTITGSAVLMAWGIAWPAAAQQSQPADAVETAPTEFMPDEKASPASSTSGARTLPGPKYFNLRYDDDFTYLEGEPGSYRKDFFDPIKYIPFGEDMYLSLGGEFRFQMLAETNTAFDARPQSQDTFQNYRYLLHFDWKHRKFGRMFLQLGAMFDEDRDLPGRPIDENRFTFQQFFVDLNPFGTQTPLTVRFGRQELQYGNQRLVSPLDWAAVRRRFDGLKLFWHDAKWDLDVFYVKPVVVRRKQRDEFDEEVDFYGAYFTYKAIPQHGIDVYFFALDDTANRVNPNGNSGDISRFTLGGRFWGNTAGFDYEAELAGQWGRWAGDTIQAWSWTIVAGYTLRDLAYKPRIGVGFDWASGDEDPNDGKVGTFDQLFPLGHAYFGYLDLIGRQNVNAVNVNLSAWPVPDKVQTALAYHTFWLNAERDAVYNAAGAPGRRDPTGNSGREIGHEIDFTLVWNIDAHQSMLFGYSHFWDSDVIINTGKSEDPDLFYVQYAFKF